MKHIFMVGFWQEELEALIKHLETTNYNEEQIRNIKETFKELLNDPV